MSCGKPCACPSYREHLLSVNVAASCLPTRHVEAARQATADMHLEKDMASYKRLRQSGVQPPQVGGSYLIEKTQMPIEAPTPVAP